MCRLRKNNVLPAKKKIFANPISFVISQNYSKVPSVSLWVNNIYYIPFHEPSTVMEDSNRCSQFISIRNGDMMDFIVNHIEWLFDKFCHVKRYSTCATLYLFWRQYIVLLLYIRSVIKAQSIWCVAWHLSSEYACGLRFGRIKFKHTAQTVKPSIPTVMQIYGSSYEEISASEYC